MRRILTALLMLVVLGLGGCQWASFRETLKPSSTSIRKQTESGTQERRTLRREIIGHYRWRGPDGKIYVQPVYRVGDPNDA